MHVKVCELKERREVSGGEEGSGVLTIHLTLSWLAGVGSYVMPSLVGESHTPAPRSSGKAVRFASVNHV